MFILSFVVLGLLIGFLRGGSLRGLAELQLRLAWLLPLALVLQIVAFSGQLPSDPGFAFLVPGLHLLSYSLVLVALACNLHLWPMRVLALGTVSNVVVILANGGYMPSSPAALRAAGLLDNLEAVSQHGYQNNSALLNEHTRLPFLADIFAIPAGVPLANVFSIGDVLIGLGALLLVVQAMGRRADRRPSPAGRRADQP